MTDNTTNAAGGEVERRIREIQVTEAEATPGPWLVLNPDDSVSMNIICVTTGAEPEDEDDLGNVVCVTLLQSGAHISTKDNKWKENAEFIAHAREDVPWLLAQLTATRAVLSAVLSAVLAEPEERYDVVPDWGVWWMGKHIRALKAVLPEAIEGTTAKGGG